LRSRKHGSRLTAGMTQIAKPERIRRQRVVVALFV
jgi:hypothetical protein